LTKITNAFIKICFCKRCLRTFIRSICQTNATAVCHAAQSTL